MLDKIHSQVREFHVAFKQPNEDKPTILSKTRCDARAEWMREEVQEFLDAPTVVDQADAMIDLIYFAVGTMVEMGVKPQKIFDIVHNANMTKIWSDGKPHYNEIGKVIKPEGWVAPEPLIEQEVRRFFMYNA